MEYIERSSSHVYKDPNPQVIRRTVTKGSVAREQRVLIRYLEPPDVPPPDVPPSDVPPSGVMKQIFKDAVLLIFV